MCFECFADLKRILFSLVISKTKVKRHVKNDPVLKVEKMNFYEKRQELIF